MLSLAHLFRRTMATNSSRSLIAVCQMTSDKDLQENFKTCKSMIERASERKCKMVFFPECFDFIAGSKEDSIKLAMGENCEFIGQFRQLAKQHGIWLSLGGLHHQDNKVNPLPSNTHLVIDSDGVTKACYNKLHLFDLEIPGKVRLKESEFSKSGDKMHLPVDTPIGRLGLSICYDLRFPELSLWNRKKGAEILSFPSAFTLNTGLAHWEALLRARAIETQCYVVAAAQTGKHNEKRMSYGHAMIVDPWGAVIAQCSERVDMCFAEIDLKYVEEIRTMQPVFEHRRNDLYSLHVNEVDSDTSTLHFAEFPILAETIFYRSAHSFAFVNLKPVLNGHVLICPKKIHLRLTDFSDEETADMFITAKKVQRMLEKHIHAHILARRAGDFGCSPDDLYKNLAEHDKKPDVVPRSLDEMAAEAAIYRSEMLKL